MVYETIDFEARDFNLIPKEELFVDTAKEAMIYLIKNHCVFINSNYLIEISRLNKVLQELKIDNKMEKHNGYNAYIIGKYIWFNQDPTMENLYLVPLIKAKKALHQISSYNEYIIPVNDKGFTSNEFYQNLVWMTKKAAMNKLKFKRVYNYEYKGEKDISVVLIDTENKVDGLMYGIAFLGEISDKYQKKNLSNAIFSIKDNSITSSNNELLHFDMESAFNIILFSYSEYANNIVNYSILNTVITRDPQQYEKEKYHIQLHSLSELRLVQDDELRGNLCHKIRIKINNMKEEKRDSIVKGRENNDYMKGFIVYKFKQPIFDVSFYHKVIEKTDFYLPKIEINLNVLKTYVHSNSEYQKISYINDELGRIKSCLHFYKNDFLSSFKDSYDFTKYFIEKNLIKENEDFCIKAIDN